MKRKNVLAVLAGGVAAFIWYSISWMVIPWHQPTMNGFDDAESIALAIKQAAPEPGIYIYPEWTDDAEDKEKQIEGRPYVFASIVPDGIRDGMGEMMVTGLLVNLIGAALLLTLMLTVPDEGWKARTLVAAIAALFVSLVPALMNWNWWHYPVAFSVVGILDNLIAWTLAGFVMAMISAGKETA